MKAYSMVIAAGAVALATFAQGAEVTWTGGSGGFGYQWAAGGWETGELPGVEDTAVFVDIPRFRSQVENGTAQSIGLLKNEEVDEIIFQNLYGVSVQGGFTMTLNSVTAESVYPTGDDIIAEATNKMAMTALALKGETSVFDIGDNHVLNLAVYTLSASAGTSIEKTGVGTWLWSGSDCDAANSSLWVKEGSLIRTGNVNPSLKVNKLIVGGAGHEAVVEFGDATHATKVPGSCDIDIRPGGMLKIDAAGSAYHEYLSVDHGTIDAPGYVFIMSNDKNTPDRDITYIFTGGTFIGDMQWPWNAPFTIVGSDKPSVVVGKMNILGNKFVVPDGSASVDFVIDGKIGGGNRQYGKQGPGTMLFIDRDPSDLYGIGRDFTVEEGTFILQSETEIGLGTNNIVVSAGATLGGTGHHVGGIDPDQAIRGLRGNITLNGASENPATLAPGTVNYETGAFIPGTFTIGSASQTNNVTFAGKSVLRIGATKDEVSKLVVNGLFTLSGSDELAIVGPEDPKKLPSGEHVIVSTKEPLAGEFTSVTYNGVALSDSVGKVKYESNAVIFRVSTRGLTITVR